MTMGRKISQNNRMQSGAVLSIEAIGWSMSLFFLVTYLLCIASAAILPDWKWHEPWLQFFPASNG